MRDRFTNWIAPAYLLQNRPDLKFTTPAVLDVVLKHCKHRRVVIQAGAHLGIWPAKLAATFKHVLAFEPVGENWQVCQDAIQAKNVIVYPQALSNTALGAWITPSKKRFSGSAFIHAEGELLVSTKKIDDLYEGHRRQLDAIILDVEGHEIDILRGGAKTIAKRKPVIVVEDNAQSERVRGKGTMLAYMRSIGYRKVDRYRDDYIYLPK